MIEMKPIGKFAVGDKVRLMPTDGSRIPLKTIYTIFEIHNNVQIQTEGFSARYVEPGRNAVNAMTLKDFKEGSLVRLPTKGRPNVTHRLVKKEADSDACLLENLENGCTYRHSFDTHAVRAELPKIKKLNPLL